MNKYLLVGYYAFDGVCYETLEEADKRNHNIFESIFNGDNEKFHPTKWLFNYALRCYFEDFSSLFVTFEAYKCISLVFIRGVKEEIFTPEFQISFRELLLNRNQIIDLEEEAEALKDKLRALASEGAVLKR